MKKIVIMAMVALGAVIVNAASVSWTVGNVRIPVADNLTVSQSGIQTTTSSDKFAASALTINLFWQNGSDWELITSAATTGEGTKAKAEFWSQAEAVANRDASNNAYFLITAEYATESGTYNFELESGAVALGNIESAAKTVTFNMNNGTWNYTAAAVPEPTSGLLMLVGLAGLALRRRRA